MAVKLIYAPIQTDLTTAEGSVRIGAALTLFFALPAGIEAQITTVDQQAIVDRAAVLYKFSRDFVEAEKQGKGAVVKSISLPNASFLDENWNSSYLNAVSIAKLAKNCNAIYGTDPEIVSGRISLPRDKQSIFWQCPLGFVSSPVKTIIEYSGDRIAFVRNVTGTSALITAVPR